MSTKMSSLSTDPGVLTAGATLADVLTCLTSLDVSSQARSNMASAVHSLCRVLDRDPWIVPIHAPSLRRSFEGASPGAF